MEIKLVTVEELLGKKFIIPKYQRGYKWTETHIKDLLDDLDDFFKESNDDNMDSFYCLQPLCVRQGIGKTETIKGITLNSESKINDILNQVKSYFNENRIWRVIDGQQRLTTIFLILSYLNINNKYSIEYESRDKSAIYLNDINTKHDDDNNIDFYHINVVYKTIKKWFENKDDENKEKFIRKFIRNLLTRTKFIWYECDCSNESDEIEIFTRLNIGKIGLTNAELIKAIFLNIKNLEGDELLQKKIAQEWDDIEKSLQNNEFWSFFQTPKYNKPTRIDYLFDLLCECEIKKGDKNGIIEKIGKDQYRTFRFFDYVVKQGGKKDVVELWNELVKIYNTLQEWYNDLYYYHYIGFLIECNGIKIIDDLIDKYDGTKEEFLLHIKNKIKESLLSEKITLEDMLNKQYELATEEKNKIDKRKCRPILLLHNIRTVIEENKQNESEDKFKHHVFHRFPFFLLKEADWDIEHIDSNTPKKLTDNFEKFTWLLQFEGKLNVELNNKLNKIIEEIIKVIKGKITSEEKYATLAFSESKAQIAEEELKKIIKKLSFDKFDDLKGEIDNYFEGNKDNNILDEYQKNQIGNFCLLDSSTNRGYGNSIFPEKRRTIMAKARRMKCSLVLEGDKFKYELKSDNNVSAYILPATRNVFMKYYTPETNDFSCWNKDDAEAYLNDIKDKLECFFNKEENNGK